jgi:hypothetical protein
MLGTIQPESYLLALHLQNQNQLMGCAIRAVHSDAMQPRTRYPAFSSCVHRTHCFNHPIDCNLLQLEKSRVFLVLKTEERLVIKLCRRDYTRNTQWHHGRGANGQDV